MQQIWSLIYSKEYKTFSARVTLNQNKIISSIKALSELHWLPIRAHIDFRILLIINKCLNDSNSPSYLQKLLVHNKRLGIKSNLRSNDSNDHLLIIPYVKQKTFAVHSFSVYGPRLRIIFQQKLKQ